MRTRIRAEIRTGLAVVAFSVLAVAAGFGLLIVDAPGAGAVATTTTCTNPVVVPADFQDLVDQQAPTVNADLNVELDAVPNPVAVGNSFDVDAVNSSVSISADDPLIALALDAGVTEVGAASTLPVSVALNGAATGATTLDLAQDPTPDAIADGYSSPLTGGDSWTATNPGVVSYSVSADPYQMVLSLEVLQTQIEATYTCTATAVDLLDVTVEEAQQPFTLVANDDVANTEAETPVDIAVILNDLVMNVQLDTTPQNLSDPANGSVLASPNLVTYTPDPGFMGVDTFTYELCGEVGQDPEVLCDEATVTVTVLEPQATTTTTGPAATTTTTPGDTTTTSDPTTTTTTDATTTTTDGNGSTTSTTSGSTTSTTGSGSSSTDPNGTSSSSVAGTTSQSRLPTTGSTGLDLWILVAGGALTIGISLAAVARRARLDI